MEKKPLFRKDTLTILIMGDMMMHSKQIENASRNNGEYDFSPYFRFIEEKIKSADIAVANMEFTLAGEPYTGYPCFSAPDSFAGTLAECGFDIFLAANNHIFDKGSAGAARTMEIYRRLGRTHGIRFTGIAENDEERKQNNPLIITKKGIRIAFINYTYGTNVGTGAQWPAVNRLNDRKDLETALSKADEEDADLSIVLPHWGTEYQLLHSRSQEEAARHMIENGADLIIGSHPHVVQDIGNIDGITVAYSLGNAVSNMSAPNTQIELMATLQIIREHNGDLTVNEPVFTYLWCSRPGGYNDSYTVIPVEEFIGRKEEWDGGWDYDKMLDTYERVRKTTDNK